MILPRACPIRISETFSCLISYVDLGIGSNARISALRLLSWKTTAICVRRSRSSEGVNVLSTVIPARLGFDHALVRILSELPCMRRLSTLRNLPVLSEFEGISFQLLIVENHLGVQRMEASYCSDDRDPQ